MELLSVTMNDGVKMRSDIEGKDNSSEDKSNYKIVRTGDMVYNSMRMWQGANGISPWDGIVSPAYTVLKPRMPISDGFFAALFKTHRLINQFRKNSQGMTSDTWNLKYPQIETIKTCIPSLSEQERIADFLTALEQRIEKQRTLVEHLKKYKRGVLNSIFSSKSNAQDSGILLSDICSSISSGKTKITTANGKYPLFGSTGIVGSTDCAECSGKIVLVARVGANAGLVNYFEGVCGVTDNTLVLKFTDQAVLPKFVYHYLQYYDVNKMVFGSGQPLVTGGQLKSIVLPNLKSDEIERIVAFFDLLDSRISCAEKELFNLNLFKKSIYQNMFI